MSGERTIGAALPRKEDYRFVTGQGRYLDDIAVPGCLYAHFVRSPHAHARIVAIDCEAARAADGVVDSSDWTRTRTMDHAAAHGAADRGPQANRVSDPADR